MTRIYLVLIFIFSTPVFADPDMFNGKWAGQGTYILNGDMTKCLTFNLHFSADKSTFAFVNGDRTCDKHSEQFYQVSMQYKEGLLYFNGQVVGSYSANKLEANYRMPDGKSFRNWRMSMRREGNHLVYEESRTMEGETTPLISFAGLLILKP